MPVLEVRLNQPAIVQLAANKLRSAAAIVRSSRAAPAVPFLVRKRLWVCCGASVAGGSRTNDAPPPVRPRSLPQDVRWEAYFIPPECLIQLLQTIASGESYNLPPLPPDTQVMDAFYDSERAAFVLFLESSFFDKANVESEGGNTHIGMPERHLNLTRGEKPT